MVWLLLYEARNPPDEIVFCQLGSEKLDELIHLYVEK